MRILAVSRAERFSPNSVERDKAIFQAVTAESEAGKGTRVILDLRRSEGPME